MNKKEKFFKKINGGILRGSQTKLAHDLKTSLSTTNKYYKGKTSPSERHLKAMSEVYGKTIKELKNIFDIDDKYRIHQEAHHSKNRGHVNVVNMHNGGLHKRIRAMETKLDFLVNLILENQKSGKQQ